MMSEFQSRYMRGKTYMIGFFITHEMVDSEASFNCDQSSLPEYERRSPRCDKLHSLIEEWLLDEPGSVEAEILIKVGHLLRFIGGCQRYLLCLKVIR